MIVIESKMDLPFPINSLKEWVVSCLNNKGVIVTVAATHNCVSSRGVKHHGASMVTTKASGVFMDNDNLARKEFFDSIKINNGNHPV